MKAFLIIFLVVIALILITLKNLRIPQTGEFVSSTNTKPTDEKWRVVARVEILNGKIVSVKRNLD